VYILSVIVGFLIVLISIFLIRNEFKKSLDLKISKLGDFSDVEKRKIIEVIEELEDEIHGLNRAFYEITGDLEGKYSIHDKQIQLIEEKIKKYNQIKDMSFIKSNNEEEVGNNRIEVDDSIETKVIKMRAKNMSINEIAKKLGIGIGELRLLLNINKKSN
jgi:hypothetical protein